MNMLNLTTAELNEALLVASCTSGPTAHGLESDIWRFLFDQISLSACERHTMTDSVLPAVYHKVMSFVRGARLVIDHTYGF